jgi:hypothetical protein
MLHHIPASWSKVFMAFRVQHIESDTSTKLETIFHTRVKQQVELYVIVDISTYIFEYFIGVVKTWDVFMKHPTNILCCLSRV